MQLLELCQGSDSAVDYPTKFRTLAAQSGWNETALLAVFHEGLHPTLQADMPCRETTTTLSQFIVTTIHLDNLGRQHHPNSSAKNHPFRHLDTVYR